MPANQLKNKVRFSSTLPKALNKKFDELARATRIPKSKLLEEAIEDLLKKYQN